MTNTNILNYTYELYDYFKNTDIDKTIIHNPVNNNYKYKNKLYNIKTLLSIVSKDYNFFTPNLIYFDQAISMTCQKEEHYRPDLFYRMYFYNICTNNFSNYFIQNIEDIQSTSIKKCVYGIQCKSYLKIGKTSNLTNRFSSYLCMNPYASLKFVIPTDKIDELEVYLHYLFNMYKYRGEWFAITHDNVLEYLLDEEGTYYEDYLLFIKRRNDPKYKKVFV